MRAVLSFLRRAVLSALFLFTGEALHGQASDTPRDYSWDLAVLNDVLAGLAPDESVTIGCLELRDWQVRGFRDAVRKLTGVSPRFATASPVVLWPSGVVPYVFDASVTPAQRRIFLDAAADWQTFAAVSFVARTTQTNYLLVKAVAGLGGGRAAVGMVGPAQTFDIGVGSWSRWVLLHEMGHTLGMVHEHQRPDRNTYITIQTANIEPGQEAAFVLLPTATSTGAYDFLSVMHYRRNSFSIGAGLDTIVAKPGFESFQDVMGAQYERPLSTLDRAGMATTYGAGAPPSAVVTNTRDGGAGSLTAALYRAVDVPGTTITFNIPTTDPGYSAASGTWTIRPTDQLPKLGAFTTLDATTQPGGAATGPKIVLDGTFTTELTDVFSSGLMLSENACRVRGFAIRNFDGDAIRFIGAGATDNIVTQCHLGCDAAGTTGSTLGQNGVTFFDGAKRNRVGGPLASDRNLISGNRVLGVLSGGSGVADNVVEGNLIGLRANGTVALANEAGGVQIDASSTGTVVRGNVISGNTKYGVVIVGSGAAGNRLEGNFIGTNLTGSAAVPNTWAGVGVFSGANGNSIGVPGRGNVISGNGNAGLVISTAGTTGNVIAGNFIGTDATGAAALPNNWSGVQIDGGASQNLVGGTAPGAGNVISGNLNYGAVVFGTGTNNNVFAGNLVGLNAAGTVALGNGWTGIGLFASASGNVIGGSPAARNFISGNLNAGVVISGVGATNNIVHGNSIGYDITGSVLRGNAWDGVAIYGGATNNQIGGLAPGSGNRIGGNGIRGVIVYEAGTIGNAIRGNRITDNGDMGIDLQTGGNLGIGSPTLDAATVALQTSVAFSYFGAASTTYRIEFFGSPDAFGLGYGEGALFLGAVEITTDATGFYNGSVNLPTTLPSAAHVTATATSPAGNTSRFSNVAIVSMTDGDGDGLPNAWETAFGLNPASSADAAADRDGDGFSNYREFLAGTNPLQPTSRLTMSAPTTSGNDAQVAFTAPLGRPYRVEKSADLITWRVWTEHHFGTGAPQNFLDPGAAATGRQFYRAAVGL